MPKLLIDEFTHLNISRQRRYQLRREAEGCCRICGKPPGPLCPTHREALKSLKRRPYQPGQELI